MKRKLFIVFVSFLIGSLAFDDEVTVEIIDENDSEQTITNENGRAFSYPQSPLLNLLFQSAAINYAPKTPGDVFDFLRDSYPLPGGEFSKL